MSNRKQKKPRIGVSRGDKSWPLAWIVIYCLIRIFGGKPIKITPSKQSTACLDGLIVTGGVDIHPERYGKVIDTDEHRIDRNRDELDFNLLASALMRNIPVLGICRGCQLINVYFGGSLHSDLDFFYQTNRRRKSFLPIKKISIKPESLLARIFSCNETKVNGLHDQAVDALGAGLLITAREFNGVVQAIEHPRFKFVLGVQWHPEFMFLSRKHRTIFREFVRAANGSTNFASINMTAPH